MTENEEEIITRELTEELLDYIRDASAEDMSKLLNLLKSMRESRKNGSSDKK